jgi:hypothetical protein
MAHIDIAPEEEYLPVFQPPTRSITDVVRRNIVHETWLHHGHINVWVPGKSDGTVIKQIKIRSHHKADATIWGHIDCTLEDFWDAMGRDIAHLAPRTAVKEWREETGLIFTQHEIIPLWEASETWWAPHSESNRWNNGIVVAYVLDRRVAIEEILNSPTREEWLHFEEVHIETLLWLTQKDRDAYLWKLLSAPYREIFLKLRDSLRHI